MNYLPIYLFVSITLIALTLLVLHIYRKQIPFLKEDKEEVNLDLEKKFDELNELIESASKNIDNQREINKEMRRL
ncbi:hypothetical protein [Arcobacter arenosus]|uniref:Uncharacterized protein n=1 Tax=Arcobacter arenosus TaxID=2576037 RepID=A0A5R8Y4L9_9BACT|nr:hypothetical protein [Arcobacter arenosus]TLP41025.1 hypothetical protein FDK22_03125 [Arcobacter arenosus]